MERIESAQPLGRDAIMERIGRLRGTLDVIQDQIQANLRDLEHLQERETTLIAEHNQLVSKLEIVP